MNLNIVNLGLIDYDKALDLQKILHSHIAERTADDTLLLLEHPPVLTLGIRGKRSNIYLSARQLDQMGVSVYEINRGGDVTYHGPGQIVGYPIFNLIRHGKDIRGFVSGIQEVFDRLLSRDFGLPARRESSEYTGVWIEDKKITAIGIEIKRWTSMHGFAFNVNTDLSHFSWINPCGLSDRGVTSLEALTGRRQDMAHLNQLIAQYFCDVFNMDGSLCSIESLTG